MIPCYNTYRKSMYNISLKIIDWLKQQIKINDKKRNPPHIHEREIWWCQVGHNIGFEEYGKGEYFQRPVLILKKFNNNLFVGILLSTKLKEENKYYKKITFGGVEISAMLSQVRTMDSKRLIERMGTLDEKDFLSVNKDFVSMFTIEKP